MGPPPQPSGKLPLVLLILGLCCAPVICQHLKSEKDLREENDPLYYSKELRYTRIYLDACNEMFPDCTIPGQKTYIPWQNRNGFYFLNMFHSYAQKEGNPETMNSKEFTDYLKVDIPDYIEDILKKEMTSLDANKDGELNMDEYFTFPENYLAKNTGPVKKKRQ